MMATSQKDVVKHTRTETSFSYYPYVQIRKQTKIRDNDGHIKNTSWWTNESEVIILKARYTLKLCYIIWR